MAKILVVDDEESIRFTFDRFLRAKGHTVLTALSCADALPRIVEANPDLVVADIILEDGTGIDLLREIRQKGLNCLVIMITGVPTVETAAEAVRLGAFDYIAKPVTERALLRATGSALRYKAVNDEKERYRSNLEAIFRSVKDVIITVDPSGAITEMNQAAMSTYVLSREAIGMPFKALPSGCNGSCLEVLEEAIGSRSVVMAERIECRSESAPGRVVSLTASPLLGPQDVFAGVVMVFRDETRLVSLEREIGGHRQFHRLVGGSPKMQTVFSLIETLASAQTTVLITGESGTGKELAAEALHTGGERRSKPLVKVNCSALPEGLLESELFGHVKGAFTGAVQERVGRFQKAHGGTLFLDEVGDLSPRIQGELLRVLQEREFERVGDSTPIQVDVRVIAATNKNLRERVRRGEFREDLYYRLKVVELELPPLREKREDIPLLVDHFRRKFNALFGKSIGGVSHDVMRVLLDHSWPGNVRELEHTLEHAFVLCQNRTITLEHLPPELTEGQQAARGVSLTPGTDDRRAILDALEKSGWNKAKAARALGINRATLYRKMRRLQISDDPSGR